MPKKTQTKRGKGIRDLLLFFVFAGVPIVNFWLQGYPDTPFYVGMFVIFLVMLVLLRQYHKEHEYERLLDYDENLHFDSFIWIALGVAGAYIVSSVIVSQYTKSVIWVPTHNLELGLGSLLLSGFWGDVLYQLVLVAPAEELCKLSLHLAFYMKLKGAFSDLPARAVSIAAPIFFWSLLHVYAWEMHHEFMLYLMVAAFVGGLIFFAVMYKTKSVLAAILTHAAYNGIIIYLQSMAVAT